MSDTQADAPYAVVIEDDPDIRELHREVLTQSGFSPILTENATAGLEAVRTHDPLVTLVDVQMVGMDGFAATRKIRQFSNTYILMVSALSDEIDVIEGLSAGADDYIQKPFRPRELRARIEAILRRPRIISHSLSSSVVHEEPARISHNDAEHPVVDGTVESVEDRPVDIGTPGHPRIQPMAPRPIKAASTPPAAPHFRTPAGVRLSTPASAAPRQPEAAPPPPPPPPPPAPVPPPPPVVEAPPTPPAAPPVQPVAPPPPAASTAPPPVTQHVSTQPVTPPATSGQPGDGGEFTHCGTLSLNRTTGEVLVEGRPVELNSGEFALVSTLVESGTRIRSTANLVLTLRDEGYVTTYYINEDDKRAVKAHMSNLMRKLGDTGVTPKWVENVRGVGYRMVVAD